MTRLCSARLGSAGLDRIVVESGWWWLGDLREFIYQSCGLEHSSADSEWMQEDQFEWCLVCHHHHLHATWNMGICMATLLFTCFNKASTGKSMKQKHRFHLAGSERERQKEIKERGREVSLSTMVKQEGTDDMLCAWSKCAVLVWWLRIHKPAWLYHWTTNDHVGSMTGWLTAIVAIMFSQDASSDK